MKIFINMTGLLLLLGCTSSQISSSYLSRSTQSTPQSMSQIPVVKPQGSLISISQGFTSETETYISIVTNEKHFYYVYSKKNTKRKKIIPFKSVEKDISKDTWRILKLKVSELDLKTEYILEVTDPQGKILDKRYFKALDRQKKNPKIAIGSCMHEGKQISDQALIWKKLLDQDPDMIFLIGDNVYIDSTHDLKKLSRDQVDGDWIFRRYIEMRIHIPLYKSSHLYPTLVTWDDHDFGVNNAGKEFKYLDETTKAFNLFWAQGALTKGPGVSSSFQAFGQNFIFLDNRTFREKNSKKEPTAHSHLGKSQRKWLLGQLQKNPIPSWLILGGQFFGGIYPWESYEKNHPKSFISFKEDLKNIHQPLGFVSGDRHFSEVMKVYKKDIGQDTFEFTSSPFHTFLYGSPWDKYPNSRQIYGLSSTINFMVLFPEVVNTKNQDLEGDLKIKFQVYGLEKRKTSLKKLHENYVFLKGKR